MTLSATDRAVRIKALTELAVATRERVEKQTHDVYLDAIDAIETAVVVEACYRLRKTATWFPKVHELLEECNVVAKERRLREEARRPRLPEYVPASPEREKQFLADFKQMLASKRMTKMAAAGRDE